MFRLPFFSFAFYWEITGFFDIFCWWFTAVLSASPTPSAETCLVSWKACDPRRSFLGQKCYDCILHSFTSNLFFDCLLTPTSSSQNICKKTEQQDVFFPAVLPSFYPPPSSTLSHFALKRALWWMHCGPDQPRIQTAVLGHLLVRSLVRSHRSLTLLTPLLVGQWMIRWLFCL